MQERLYSFVRGTICTPHQFLSFIPTIDKNKRSYENGKKGAEHGQKAVVQRNKWLTQKAMAQLFGVQVSAINKHLKNIFSEGELIEKVVISK